MYMTEILENEVDGQILEGIFIPFKYNPIYRGQEGHIFLNLFANEIRINANHQTHILKPCIFKEKEEELEEIGAEIIPVGFMKRIATKKRNYKIVDKSNLKIKKK